MLEIRESYINETKGHGIGDSDWYEPFTDDRGQLFRFMQREYGGCVSRIYRDTRNGPPVAVGWVFSKRMTYDNCAETYIREVWVELRDLEATERAAEGKRYVETL